MIAYDSEAPTPPSRRAPTMLFLGGGPKLAEMVRSAAVRAQLLVSECAERDGFDVALALRPLVIALSAAAYDRLSPMIDDVARDVGASVFVLRDESGDEDGIAEQLLRLTDGC